MNLNFPTTTNFTLAPVLQRTAYVFRCQRILSRSTHSLRICKKGRILFSPFFCVCFALFSQPLLVLSYFLPLVFTQKHSHSAIARRTKQNENNNKKTQNETKIAAYKSLRKRKNIESESEKNRRVKVVFGVNGRTFPIFSHMYVRILSVGSASAITFWAESESKVKVHRTTEMKFC